MKRILILFALMFSFPAQADTVQSMTWNPTTKTLNALTKQSGTQQFAPIKGVTDGSLACQGCVGETFSLIHQSAYSQSPATSGTYYDVTGVVLTPTAGSHRITWQVAASAIWSVGSGCITTVVASIRTSANAIVTEGACTVVGDPAAGRQPTASMISNCYLAADVNITTPTTYKGSLRVVTQTGTCTSIDLGSRCDYGDCILKTIRTR